MALVMTPDLVARYISSLHPVVSASAATLLGAAATFGPQLLRSPAIEIARREIGEFAFHNGALLPHQQYLYGVDQNGEPYIVGKKLVGQDYSAWEAEYAKFPRLESQTMEARGSKVTCSWSVDAPETSISPSILQILLWLVFGIFCALAIRYLAKRFRNRNRLVREMIYKYQERKSLVRELIFEYQERKSEILSLTKRVFHLNDDIRKTEKLARGENKKKIAARTDRTAMLRTILRMKSEHARKLLEQQKEIDRLQQKLDSFLGNSGHADAEGGKAESDNLQAPLDMDQPESSTDPVTDHEDAAVEGEDGTAEATDTVDEGQDEKSPAVDEQSAGLGDEDRASAAEQDDSFPTLYDEVAGQGDVYPTVPAHQDNGPSTPNEQSADPTLGKSGKPLRQRRNRRSDGTIRTASHPDFVPLEEAQAQHGDRPFGSPGSGRGGRGPRGRGGNWGGGNGRGGGRFGWRGGSERGWGGRGGNDGQYGQGRGQ